MNINSLEQLESLRFGQNILYPDMPGYRIFRDVYLVEIVNYLPADFCPEIHTCRTDHLKVLVTYPTIRSVSTWSCSNFLRKFM